MSIFEKLLSMPFWLYEKLKTRDNEQQQQEDQWTLDQLWNTALFFPDYFPENEDSTTSQLIWYMEEATETIDVCMYHFNFKMLEDVLVKIAERGVAVRIITDRRFPRRKRQRFTNAGISTRCKRHLLKASNRDNMFDDVMHHKFVVIDRYGVMTGSLNWTWPGIAENKDNVAVTNNEKAVKAFSCMFEKIWNEQAEK